MRAKIFLLFLISINCNNSANSQQLGWSFDEIVRLKGKNYKFQDPIAGKYSIIYETSITIINGREVPVGFGEVYLFDSTTNMVRRYFAIGYKRETDIVEIIEKNNSKFKKVDFGAKQNFYQWIDPQNSAEYNLTIHLQEGDYKFISYLCEIRQ